MFQALMNTEYDLDIYRDKIVTWVIDKVKNMDEMDLTEMAEDHLDWNSLVELGDELEGVSLTNLLVAIQESEKLEPKVVIARIESDTDAEPADMYYCPECGWDSTFEGHAHSENVTIKNFKKGDGKVLEDCTWTAVWTCPVCETEFEFPNGI